MDLRVMKTKRAIKRALLDLLKAKPMDAITVKELCGAAEVSKPAFYYHYKNAYDVLAEIEDEAIEEITGRIARTDLSDFGSVAFVKAFGRSVFGSPLRSVLSSEPLRRDFTGRLSSALGKEFAAALASDAAGRKALAVTFAFDGLLGTMDLLGEERSFQAAPMLADLMKAVLAVSDEAAGQ